MCRHCRPQCNACPFCRVIYHRESFCSEHMKQHPSCSQCSSCFLNQDVLREHESKQNRCAVCASSSYYGSSKVYCDEEEYKQHIKQHPQCTLPDGVCGCKKFFPSFMELQVHVCNQQQADRIKRNPYICQYCNWRF